MGYASGLHREVLFTIGLVLFAFIMIINTCLTRFLKPKNVEEKEKRVKSRKSQVVKAEIPDSSVGVASRAKPEITGYPEHAACGTEESEWIKVYDKKGQDI